MSLPIQPVYDIFTLFKKVTRSKTQRLNNSDIIANQEALDLLQSNIEVVQLNLDNEATQRLNGDGTLSNDLQLETITRTNADEDLQTELDLKASQTQLETETEERIASDTLLQTNIENETTDRVNGDVNLSNSLQALQITVNTKQAIINDGDLTISKVSGLQTALDLEQTTRTSADEDLQTQIIQVSNDLATSIENVQSRITTEIDDREIADTTLQQNINLKLAEANSIHRENYAFYCVDGRNDLHSVLPNVNNQGSYISISSGSFSNLEPLIIDKDNLSIFSVPSTPPICEFACPLTVASTANRIRMRYMSFDNVCNLNGKRCVYTHSNFNDDVNIGSGTTEYMTFANCEFSAGKTITFSATMASVVYIIECNIGGASLVFNNDSPVQVIFSNCSGFVSLPTTAQATLVGLNVLTTGVSQHNISQIVLPTTGSGTLGQVLTSGGAGSVNTWTTPSGGGGGGSGGSSILKEYFSRYCLGQSVSTSSGNIILENITTEQSITNIIYNSNTVYINGSSISYIPPANTSIVEYEFSFCCYSEGANDNVLQLEFHIDSITQTPTRQKILLNGSSVGSTNNKGQMLYTFKTLIEINGIADNADKCSLNTWTTSKTLKLKIAKWGNTNLWLHKHDNYFASTGFVTTIIPPTLTIKAY